MSLLGDLNFADNVALLSSTRDQLQWKPSNLLLAAKQLGLNIYWKTKTMQLMDTPLTVELEKEDLEVEKFTYLGRNMR